MKKTKNETIRELKLHLQKMDELYKSKCLNWSGKTIDTGELYSEILSNELIQEVGELDKIQSVTRQQSYLTANHCNIKIDVCKSNRLEENFAKRLVGLKLAELGLIFEYQVPLKNKKHDLGLGKIDLLSFNETTGTLYLIELKCFDNKETLLRATFECYTYYRIVDKVKLLKDCFTSKGTILANALTNPFNVQNIKIVPAILLESNCYAYKELIDLINNGRPKLKALAKLLNVKYLSIDLATKEIVL